MMRIKYRIAYQMLLVENTLEINFAKPPSALGSTKPTMVPGIARKRGSKDDGQNTAHVYLNGHVGILAAVLLPAHDPLGILYGDTALGAVHQHDERDHRDEKDHNQRHPYIVLGIELAQLDIGRSVW